MLAMLLRPVLIVAITSAMPMDFTAQLRAMAEVIVRVGVNLQPGQPLLITEPYELQGVHPETGPLIEAIRSATVGHEVIVIPSEPARLRTLVEADDHRGFEALLFGHTRRVQQHLTRGGAFLFLIGSQPQLMSGLPAERLSRFDRIKWRHFGPVIQRLTRGASQWTLAPAPSSAWADAAYADLPTANRLPALWRTVFEAMRVDELNEVGALRPESALSGHKAPPTFDPIELWRTHLAGLACRRDELNTARHRSIRYVGSGTNLTLDLPRSHVWHTAQLVSKKGVPFVANLPTEEIFTAPHKNSANGTARVARPVTHSGSVIDGIELEFSCGRVVNTRANTGQDILQQLLATDEGACRLGEVALVPALMEVRSPTDRGPSEDGPTTWQNSGRLFHHTLLDENAGHHIALGDAYRFCSRALMPLALNSSQIHLDLPLDAEVVRTS